MEPEIDKRCPDCGAAVRQQAVFCPQCGRSMKPENEAARPEEKPVAAEPPSASNAGDLHAARPLAVTAASSKEAEPVSLPAQVAREQIASGKPVEPPPRPQGRGQRVVGAARDVVEERLAPRVERIKQASNVVWGEAQDDPNLRFILVAVFLFILAIGIILLGTYLR